MRKIVNNYSIYLLLIASNLFAQINVLDHIMKANNINTDERRNLSRAKSHEHAGLYDEANLIYKQLFNQNPKNQNIFSSYKSFLKKQNKWETLIEISIIYSNAIAPDPFGKLALADSYLLAEEDAMAFNIFDQLFSTYSNDIQKLKRFTSKLIYNNQIDFGLKKILHLRKIQEHSDFYAKDLGAYYYSKRQYSKSLHEYILYLNHNPNKLNQIQDKLMRFPEDDEIKNDIRKTLKNYNSKLCNIILAEYEFKWRNYGIAYSLIINNYTNDEEIYEFAIDMVAASQLFYAEKIFNKLIISNNKKIAESSIYQLANIIELRVENNNQKLPISDNIITRTFFDLESFYISDLEIESTVLLNAIAMYDSLASYYDNPAARYKLAELKSQTNKNYSESIADFNYLEKKSRDRGISFLSAIKNIDLHIINGKADYELITKIDDYEKKYNKKDELVLLSLKKNQVLFYLKEFDELSQNLMDILKILPKDNEYYNDFIDGFATLMLFDSNKDALNQFSSAVYYIKQNDFIKSTPLLLELNSSNEKIIVNLSSYYLSYIYIKLNDYSLAEEIISKEYGDDIYSQMIKLLSAEIDDYINQNTDLAIDKYLYFLDSYNSSIYYEDIRLRLRSIVE